MLFFVLSQAFYVKEIRWEGIRWADTSEVASRFGVSAGEQARMRDVDDGVKALMATGRFEDVKVFATQLGGDTLSLRVVVVEAPEIADWEMRFNRKVKTKEFRDTLNAYKGKFATGRTLWRVRAAVLRKYRDKGFLKAQVQVDTQSVADGKVKLIITVQEGEKYKIGKIEIRGNRAYPDRVLLGLMQNRPLNFWRRLLRGGKLDQEKLYRDMDAIEAFYRDHGYPQARVDSYRVEGEGGLLTLTLFITEGKRFRFGRVGVEGAKNIDTALILSKITIGKPYSLWSKLGHWWKYRFFPDPGLYSKSRVDESVRNISMLYGDSGYLYVQVDPRTEIRDDSIMDFRFKIDERWKVKIRKIYITGNTRTYDNVILRELDIFPGEYFSSSKLQKSLRDLYYLNYFQNLDVRIHPLEDSSWADLEILVEEKATGQVGAGMSYSGLEGFFVNVSLREPNFLGRGQSIIFMVDWGARRRNFQLGFTEPWLGGKPISVGGSIYNLTRYLSYYTQESRGLSLTYSTWLWSDLWRGSAAYNLEWMRLSNISDLYQGMPMTQLAGGLLSSAITLGITYDSRNRFFNAYRGSRLSYSLRVNGGPLGGEAHYVKHMAEAAGYTDILWRKKLVTVARVKWGSLFGMASGTQVPFWELFLLGDIGPYGLRGYEWRSVGVESGGGVVGGRHFCILTLEERYRLSDQVYFLAFLEAGNTWWRLSDVRPELKRSAGVGVRMEVPMLGVMGFDLGYGFDNDGGKFVPHIQFGQFF